MSGSKALFAIPLLAVAAVLAWFALQGADPEVRGLEPGAAPPRSEPEETRLAPSAEDESGIEASVPAEEERVLEAEPEIAQVGADEEPELAHLIGRILLPDGAPAAGATLRVLGWTGNQDRAMKYGVPTDWEDPEGVTDQEGRFDLAFDPPRAYQFTLDVELAGYAELSWRWHEILPGEVKDVGDQALGRAGTVVGRVVAQDGRPTGDSWRVYGDSSFRPAGEGADETRVSGEVDPATGAFRLENVPVGQLTLKAYTRIANWIDGPTVIVKPGEETEAEIVYEGPDNSDRIVVIVFCRPYYVFNDPAEGTLTLTRNSGEVVVAEKVEGSSQSYSFDDLEAGSYTVQIDDPLFRPWSRSGVQPGETVNAHLEGSAAVALTLRDEAGALVEDYGLKLRFEGANFWPNVFSVRARGTVLPAGGLYEGLIPFATTLVVQAEGFAELELPLGELVPGEVRVVEGTLERGVIVAGVVQEGGRPVANATVIVHPHVPGYDPDDPFSLGMSMSDKSAFESRTLEAETDARGAFRFGGVGKGTYDVRANLGLQRALAAAIEVGSEGKDDLVLELPGMGFVIGRVTGPPRADFTRIQLAAEPDRGEDARRNPFHSAPPTLAEFEEDGSYRLGPLPEGPYRILVLTPDAEIPNGPNSSMTSPGHSEELGRVAVVAGDEVQADFDLTNRFPGAIELDIRVGGDAGVGLVVVAMEKETGAQCAGRSDVEGRVRLSPILPGSWRVRVQPIDPVWAYAVPQPVSLEAGGTATLSLDIPLAEGRVRLLDASTGDALGSHPIGLQFPGGAMRPFETDAEGWLTLLLPPGEYALGAVGTWFIPKGTGGPRIVWGPDGPDSDEIRLDVGD